MSTAIEAVSEVAVEPQRDKNVWRCAGKIFLVFGFFYLLTSSGRVRSVDEYMAFFETESLVQKGSTAAPQAVQLNYYYGKYDVHGEPHTPYPPGHPLLAVPSYLLGHYAFFDFLSVGIEREARIPVFSVCWRGNRVSRHFATSAEVS